MRTLRFDIVSIFPGMFESPFGDSIIQRAREEGLLDIRVHDLRDYSLNKHKKVDDTPFGGGVGMVMNVEPIARVITEIKKEVPETRTILLSPGGRPFDQERAGELSHLSSLTLICGRYEGIDERVRLHFVDEEVSIGDYVLTGGEIPAMVLVEAISRLVPGVLGDPESVVEESFANDLLEYPQYTRPRDYQGFKVPEILISGDHKKIRDWQKAEALKKTAQVRPDLLKKNKRQD
ncbi:MAG: tRNA (guanosine(37)-N1)-methyltransferase TrmD [Nitrospina sp.]|nr:tRNA (guanosine(37)-N1)-methyltransferase TrmD [Nitrospina sp.]MBT3413942.1 tRNA (guanosine(37)-N1)-methyltransferase TrmD [Nitrospina sp.]MBT3855689.1 tRNA (guanosine(37)-N1)-methyltransferase TrmD [Nitrospina sp.]MBT4104512.1 tRNA (guanosine(37)-N1)-methyltransferase TrmD [Nitrospina sp.]MBT4389877.1 tRNA (guanosine(37)-N1)-methyltransferase TrmD [Nitrospina sp.]